MKSLIILLAPLSVSAALYTNQPVLLDAHTYPLDLPIAELPPIVGPTFTIASPDAPFVFGLDDSVAGYDGPLVVTNTGYMGFTAYLTDITGWPVEGIVEVVINGQLRGHTRGGYVGTDERGVIELLCPPDTYSTITAITWACSPPSLTATVRDGQPTAVLQGQPYQAYGLCASDKPDGPWKRVKTGKLDGQGKAEVAVDGKFYRSE